MAIFIDIIFNILLCWITPKETIEKAIDIPLKIYKENKEKFGDHKFSVFDN